MGRLDGKTALVVGATAGLGRALAVGFAREGAGIIALGRTKQAFASLEGEIAATGSRVATRALDVRDREAFVGLAHWLEEEKRDYDIVVYTPGGGLQAVALDDAALRTRITESRGRLPFWEIEDSHFEQMMAVGVRGAVLCCKYLAPSLIRKGSGSFIFIGSASGIPGEAVHGDAAYCAEKGALMSYVLFVAKELKPHGVAANVLLPGVTLTRLTKGYPHAENFPGITQPEDALPAALFLAEQDANGTTGQIVDARSYREPVSPKT